MNLSAVFDLSVQQFVTYLAYWCLFWTAINWVLPPRETFKDFPTFLKYYNLLLTIVSYWGALNWRQKTVEIYGKFGMELAPSISAAIKNEPPKDV